VGRFLSVPNPVFRLYALQEQFPSIRLEEQAGRISSFTISQEDLTLLRLFWC
jgi:hypothetical protein